MAIAPEEASSIDGTDPGQAPETLNLTGNLLLATASIPYKASFGKENGGWVRQFLNPMTLLCLKWLPVKDNGMRLLYKI